MINPMAALHSTFLASPERARRVKIALGILALAIPFGLAELNLSGFGGMVGNGGAKPAMAIASTPSIASKIEAIGASMLDVLGLRSPGERSKGELADSKAHAHRLASYHRHPSPHQRALAKVRPPQLIPLSPPSDVTTAPVANALTSAPDVGPPAVVQQLAPVIPPVIGTGPGGGFLPGGGFPSGGGFPPGGGNLPPPPPPPPPPPSAVPEPSTWALMLLGFWGIGSSLRRRPKTLIPAHGVKATAASR